MVAAVGVVPRDRALRAVQVMDGFGVAFGRALVVSNGIAKGKKADPEQQEPGHHAQFVRRHGSRSRLSVSRLPTTIEWPTLSGNGNCWRSSPSRSDRKSTRL